MADALQNIAVSLISGCTAGIAVDSVVFPLDTIKTRLQSNANSKPFSKGIYSGISYNIIASSLCTAAFFGVYDYIKNTLYNHKVNTHLTHMTSAAIADFTASLLRNPFEVVKQNRQIHSANAKSYTLINYLKTQPRMLYKGWIALICREIPFSVIEFTIYEDLKKRFGNSGLQSCLNGCLSGVFTGFVTNPIDIIKTRMMVGEKLMYRNLAAALISEGPSGLMRGIIARCMYLGIGGVAFFGCYEYVSKMLKEKIFAPR